MSKQYRLLFWVIASSLIFVFFWWLFSIAVPDIAFPFSIGATLVIIGGLMVGRAISLISLNSDGHGQSLTPIVILGGFIVLGLVTIAFLLNAMIEKTTLFPFAVTVLCVFLVTAATGAIITIIRYRYKMKVVSAQVAMAQSKSELQLLQSQLSPHFLFNTLNNLYGLSLTEPNRVPPLILKLSELLRYSVYDVKEIFILLQYEADYLRNYIEFERIRLGERLDLEIEMDSFVNSDWRIPPLLLVVFVENAFKHSRSTSDDKIHIQIRLIKKGKSIQFVTRNSCSEEASGGAAHSKHSGFGLDSVRKRLELLYAGKYSLHTSRTRNEYVVQLHLECL